MPVAETIVTTKRAHLLDARLIERMTGPLSFTGQVSEDCTTRTKFSWRMRVVPRENVLRMRESSRTCAAKVANGGTIERIEHAACSRKM